MHAREWITTMVTEYIAHSLLRQYGVDADVKHALDSFDFYIFPVVNPDGTDFPHHPSDGLTTQASSTPKPTNTTQASSTRKPKTACGARTGRRSPAPRASAAT